MSQPAPETIETPARQDRLTKWKSGWLDLWLEWPPFRLLLIAVELGSFLAGAAGVWFAKEALDVANEARRDQQVSEARQMLLNPPPGLFDLGEAARTILASGGSLNALRVTCGTGLVAGPQPGPRCQPSMDIGEIEVLASGSDSTSVADLPPTEAMRKAITRSMFDGVNFYDSRFDGVVLRDALFYSSTFSGVAFDHCRIEHSSFIQAYFEQSVFSTCQISSSSFAGADLRSVSFEGTSMFEVDISGATLCSSELSCVSGLTTENMEGMYYYDDNPPVMLGLPVPGSPKVCPQASRETMRAGGVARCDEPEIDPSKGVPAPGQDFPSIGQ